MSQDSPTVDLSILDLPTIVTRLFERAQRPLLPGSQKPSGLFVRYLRRKPGRGLAVIYNVTELGAPLAVRKAQASDPHRAVSLTLDELALDGARIRLSSGQVERAQLEVQPSGVVRVADSGISVQAFPADNGLPALAASCTITHHGLLFQALEDAARQQLHDQRWQLTAAHAEPVRYKPASRCVIRYHLVLEHPAAEAIAQRHLLLFGKVYGDPAQARTVQTKMQQLYTEQERQGQPFLPRPLGILDELGLTLNEAVQPPEGASMLTGTSALRPQLAYGRGGEVLHITLPDEELRHTAAALARLHTSSVQPAGAPRTGAKEAKRARERAGLIAGRNPAQAEEVQQLAHELATRLEDLQPDTYRPAHGGFKASQLLVHSHNVFVVDFDGFCLADPALDVGYFLAYLRPSGLWYQRAGMRQWFESAATLFVSAYRQAMLEHSLDQALIDGIIQRSRLYEAALLFKIATRRVNRLNSPRPKELSAMLKEIATCLADEAGRV